MSFGNDAVEYTFPSETETGFGSRFGSGFGATETGSGTGTGTETGSGTGSGFGTPQCDFFYVVADEHGQCHTVSNVREWATATSVAIMLAVMPTARNKPMFAHSLRSFVKRLTHLSSSRDRETLLEMVGESEAERILAKVNALSETRIQDILKVLAVDGSTAPFETPIPRSMCLNPEVSEILTAADPGFAEMIASVFEVARTLVFSS